jgi:hypothetical protein
MITGKKINVNKKLKGAIFAHQQSLQHPYVAPEEAQISKGIGKVSMPDHVEASRRYRQIKIIFSRLEEKKMQTLQHMNLRC